MLDWTQDMIAGFEFPSEPDRCADEEGILTQPRKPGPTDWILGGGASLMIHVLMAVAALLSTHFVTAAGPREICFTVSLVDVGGGGPGSDTARNEGPSGAPGAHTGQTERTEETGDTGAQTPIPPDAPKEPQAERQLRSSDVCPVKRAQVSPDRRKAAKEPPSNTPRKDSTAVASVQCGTNLPGSEVVPGNGQGGAPAPGGISTGKGASGGEFEAHMVDQKPVPIRKVKPVYPPRARQMGIVGKVLVKFLVEPDGSIARPLIVDASPRGVFEQSVLESVVQMRFKPGYYRGRAVSVWVTAPVQFRLTDEDEY